MAKNLLISDFTNHYFRQAFKSYFNELGINIMDWEALFHEMNDEKDNRAYVRLTDTDEVIGFVQFKLIGGCGQKPGLKSDRRRHHVFI